MPNSAAIGHKDVFLFVNKSKKGTNLRRVNDTSSHEILVNTSSCIVAISWVVIRKDLVRQQKVSQNSAKIFDNVSRFDALLQYIKNHTIISEVDNHRPCARFS